MMKSCLQTLLVLSLLLRNRFRVQVVQKASPVSETAKLFDSVWVAELQLMGVWEF